MGQTNWLVNFVSHGWLFEVMAIFRERSTILDLTEHDFADFAEGLKRVFSYMDSKGIYSFNLNIYSGTSETAGHFWTYTRVVPPFIYSPVEASDTAVGRILHDWCFAFWNPEEVCTELKPYFK